MALARNMPAGCQLLSIFVEETVNSEIRPYTIHGKFHMEDNGLKFTSTWESAHLPKSTESHLNKAVDFFRGLAF